MNAPTPSPAPSPVVEAGPANLAGASREELRDVLMGLGVPERQSKMRVQQLWHWLYHRGAQDFAQMTTMSKNMRAVLAEHCEIRRPEVTLAQTSQDGTRKWLLRLDDGSEVESVFIPEEGRGTLCVSSQVGCTLNCTFCHTGTQRLVRNLSAAEIVQQVLVARDALGEWPSPTEDRQLTNIVFMGMGEPLYNFENVKAALGVIMDPEGIQLSRRRITLSTAGVIPMMARCGEELEVNLAVSLHAVRSDVRDRLVPLNKKYPLDDLLAACAAYPGATNSRRITFEYTMIKGVNDSLEDAAELVRLLRAHKIPAKVNLIPFNPWPGVDYGCSDPESVKAFSDYVFSQGISAPVRTPRGRDIMAACGQLKSASEKLRKSQRPVEAATE